MTSQLPPASTLSPAAEPRPIRQFPADFLWGVATSAYQIEGAVRAGGRGRSIWDTFTAQPGRVRDGATGEVAADHYHRYTDDVRLMRDLGVGAYRFSVAWPRVQPTGAGPANPAGLDFYRRLVDALLDQGITPWVTLYHWDLPQRLEDAGGWAARDTAERFADYALAVHRALGDRVRYWTTHNEPWCAAFLGYASGEHAPGRQSPEDAVRAAHHLLLGHGLAVQALRAAAAPAQQVGITVNLYPVDPARPNGADRDAARRIDGLQNRIFLDPLLRGEYPADVLADLAPVTDFAHVRPGDLRTIAAPLDLLGVNYYTRHVATVLPDGVPEPPSPWPGSPRAVTVPRGLPATAMGWEVDSPGLLDVLLRLSGEYASPPLYITENGAAFDDTVSLDGQVRDGDRLGYLDAHLRVAHEALARGVDLRGYFAWSLLDNFEWAHGYTRRFGIVHVDFATQRRTPKASAHWYRDVISRGGLIS